MSMNTRENMILDFFHRLNADKQNACDEFRTPDDA